MAVNDGLESQEGRLRWRESTSSVWGGEKNKIWRWGTNDARNDVEQDIIKNDPKEFKNKIIKQYGDAISVVVYVLSRSLGNLVSDAREYCYSMLISFKSYLHDIVMIVTYRIKYTIYRYWGNTSCFRHLGELRDLCIHFTGQQVCLNPVSPSKPRHPECLQNIINFVAILRTPVGRF